MISRLLRKVVALLISIRDCSDALCMTFFNPEKRQRSGNKGDRACHVAGCDRCMGLSGILFNPLRFYQSIALKKGNLDKMVLTLPLGQRIY